MAGSTANPRVWLNGDVYVAPVGSTGPSNIATALDAAFKPLGLLSEDGASMASDQDTTDHWAWGNILVRTIRSKNKKTIKVTALENNLVVFGLVNPGSGAVSATGITTRTIKAPTADPRAFVVELKDGSITTRIYIPRGEVSEVAEITLAETEMTAYELTISIYAASDGTQYLEITNDPQAVVP